MSQSAAIRSPSSLLFHTRHQRLGIASKERIVMAKSGAHLVRVRLANTTGSPQRRNDTAASLFAPTTRAHERALPLGIRFNPAQPEMMSQLRKLSRLVSQLRSLVAPHGCVVLSTPQRVADEIRASPLQ